jgi:hypothetical protein
MAFESIVPVGTSNDTLLTISGLGTMLYQARGLTQTLEAIGASKSQSRTVNGRLLDMSNPIFRKYLSKITCTDSTAPPIDNLWPGLTVTVHCAAELAYLTGNIGSPSRNEVSGSSRTEGNFTLYRPVLTMLIQDVNQHLAEWAGDIQWEISLEEV